MTHLARQACPGRDPAERGFTLIEVTFVTALVGALTLLIVQSLADLARTQAYSQGQARLAEVADRVLRGVSRDVSFSVRVFSDGTETDDYLAALAHPGNTWSTGSRLPVLTDVGFFQADAEGELNTGNVLFLARNDQPALVDVNAVVSGSMLVSAATTKAMRIDTLRFVIHYLRDDPDGLQIARWSSAPLARYKDILSIADATERTRALRQLYLKGIRYAWKVTTTADQGLFVIDASGTILPRPTLTLIASEPSQTHADLIADGSISVAYNGKAGKAVVPQYGQATPAGFPGGFEVRADGPSTGKLLLVRLVLRSGADDSRENHGEVVRMISCRDG